MLFNKIKIILSKKIFRLCIFLFATIFILSLLPSLPFSQYKEPAQISKEGDPKPIKTIEKNKQQFEAANNNYGIAAGGGLIYLSQDDLDIYFNDLKDLGVAWVRWDLEWSAIQPLDSDSYDWSGADRVVDTAKKYGIKSLGTITYAPKWAQSGKCDIGKQCPPKDPNLFAHFAGIVAERYKNTINVWEIWNEPNYTTFWSPKPNIDNYVNLLKTTYIEIKKTSPQATIMSGGLASTGDEKNGNISPITFITSLYELGAQNYFDAVALHPYTYPASPSYIASWNSWQQINLIRKLMIDRGDTAKKIWITEYGAPTNGKGIAHNLDQLNFKYDSDYMSENAQEKMVREVVALYKKNIDWMGPFFWYNLRDNGISKDTTENFFGLIRYNGSKKPAYQALKNIIISNSAK